MSRLNTSMQTIEDNSSDDDRREPDVVGYGTAGNDNNEQNNQLANENDDEQQQQMNYYNWPAFCSCLPVFMGYSALVSLQERLRKKMGITGKSSDANSFDVAVSSLFYVVLVMRLFHNVLFGALGATPRQRVFIGYALLSISLLVVSLVVFLLDGGSSPSSLWLIALIYIVGGMGISCFECNYISAITPLGNSAKKSALAAMPLGYSGLSIFAFLYFAARPDDEAAVWIVFLLVAVACGIGSAVFAFHIPDVRYEASEASMTEFLEGLAAIKEWGTLLAPNLVAMFCNMFVVILLSGAPEYVYNIAHVKLWHSGPTVPKNVFLSLFFVFGLAGDLSSRFVAYRVKSLQPCGRASPLEYLVLVVAGCCLSMSTVGILAWPGAFVALFANGFIYAASVRRLDTIGNPRHNLVALSCWLLVGDAGSSIGSTLTHTLSRAVGTAG